MSIASVIDIRAMGCSAHAMGIMRMEQIIWSDIRRGVQYIAAGRRGHNTFDCKHEAASERRGHTEHNHCKKATVPKVTRLMSFRE
jgi:hypothetical protein